MAEKLAIIPVKEGDRALISDAEKARLSHSAQVNSRTEIEARKREARIQANMTVQEMLKRGILQEEPELSLGDEQDIRNTVSRSIERHRTRH